ncbi:MAG: DUF4038 domain-containing protein [Gemmatimonadetes bacterium]|nr:DUF4038 domain-containing protein [Gemmatimonadota bacterium]
MTELTFTSQAGHSDPYNDVELDVLFANGEQTIRVPAFWAGDDIWKVRFAAPAEGDWTYETICTFTTGPGPNDAGLCAQTGTIRATPYAGDNPLLLHGRLQVSESQRYLEHVDGTPFLWIGDTWWMGLTTRLDWPSGFQTLAADRVSAGFSAIQIITGPYPDMTAWDPRGRSEAGFPFADNFERISPAYYDAADLKIGHLVQSGLMPCIVGMWGYYLPQIGVERIKRYWRYIVARYSAYPVCWCIAGEAAMPYYLSENKESEAQEQKSGWTEVTRYVHDVDGHDNPVTIHPTQFGRQQVEDPGVLDFEMLQTGHGGFKSLINNVEAVRESRAIQPAMPTFVSEVSYEGILGRCHADVQRMSFWQAILSGAFGHTYGANGIWQMSTEADPYGPSPHGRSWGSQTWQGAYRSSGSRHVGLARQLLTDIQWWRLETHDEWIENPWDGTDYDTNIAAGIPGELRVIYVPQMWNLPQVLEIEPNVSYESFWFDPMTGDRTDTVAVEPDADGAWTPPHPVVVHDWVLVLTA